LLVFVISGCGSLKYTPPSTELKSGANTTTVNQPLELFWRAFVSGLSTEFFVINNLDKETGLINVSYSGDPEKFIDCGQIINDFQGKIVQFPAASANQTYNHFQGLHLMNVNRQMNLEGRINILVREFDSASSIVTVNTRYVVTRRINSREVGQYSNFNNSDSASFNYGQDGILDQELICRSKGTLEREILTIAEWSSGMKQRPERTKTVTEPQNPKPAAKPAEAPKDEFKPRGSNFGK
jgi:hypothetical protein